MSCPDADDEQLNGEITIRGNRTRVAIGQHARASRLSFSLGNNCTIEIGENCRLGSLFIHAARGAEVSIGSDTAFTGRTRLMLHEKGKITIGKGCLFASEIDVTISDMHSIIEVESGKRINPPSDIAIGDRVWVAQRAMILKGSRIDSGSIIGAAAVVSGHIPENSLAIGIPAKVTRSGVTWAHKLL